MSRTRIVNVRAVVTYYNFPGTPTELLTHQQSLHASLANTPYETHEVTLVDKAFSAHTIQAADDLAWEYRRSPQFKSDFSIAAVERGIPDPTTAANRDLFFYSVLNVLTK